MTEKLRLDGPEHDKTRGMLRDDLIAWFTTVGADGVPHAVPVWFYWLEEGMLVFTEPTSVKVRHVQAGSPVLLHLQAGGPFGDDVVVMTGRAVVSERDAASWAAEIGEGYRRKYGAAMADLGAGVDEIVARYRTALVFTPEKLLAW